jgi:hypothetical protein
MTYKRNYILLFAVVLMFLMASCVRNIQKARHYVIDKPFSAVIILPPTSVIKSVYPGNPDSYQETPDKLDIEQSLFIKDIDDETVISTFVNSIHSLLTKYGYRVYGPADMADFMASGKKAFVFSIAQLEIMEYPDTIRPSYVYENVYYEQAIKINTIVQNTWFEFSELNHPDRPMNVLFSMQHTADFIDGKYSYDWNRGSVVYEYTPFRLSFDDIQRLNEFAGQKAARYIYDYLMNVFVSDKTGKPFNVNNYLTLDRERRIIRKAELDERFYIIKMQE